MFLLDTNHIVCWQYGTSIDFGFLKARIEKANESELFVSIVSFHEEIVGWNKYLSRATNSQGMVKAYSNFERILQDFGSMQLLPFDDRAADIFDELASQGIRRVGAMDLRTAAIAIANQAILLTQNTVDFERIPDLQIEDWMRPL